MCELSREPIDRRTDTTDKEERQRDRETERERESESERARERKGLETEGQTDRKSQTENHSPTALGKTAAGSMQAIPPAG